MRGRFATSRPAGGIDAIPQAQANYTYVIYTAVKKKPKANGQMAESFSKVPARGEITPTDSFSQIVKADLSSFIQRTRRHTNFGLR
jgi:hypothetical protein